MKMQSFKIVGVIPYGYPVILSGQARGLLLHITSMNVPLCDNSFLCAVICVQARSQQGDGMSPIQAQQIPPVAGLPRA